MYVYLAIGCLCRCLWCVGGCGGREREEGEEGEGVKEKRYGFIHKSAEVASIARIPVSDIILGKSANDVRTVYMYIRTLQNIILHTYVAYARA